MFLLILRADIGKEAINVHNSIRQEEIILSFAGLIELPCCKIWLRISPVVGVPAREIGRALLRRERMTSTAIEPVPIMLRLLCLKRTRTVI